MEYIRASKEYEGVDPAVVNLATSNVEPETLSHYASGWKVFAEWFNRQDFDDTIVSPERVAKFLQEKFDSPKNYTVGTLKGYRSAISMTADP